MTSLANNPKYPDITVEFRVMDGEQAIHVGWYHLSSDVARRACAERFNECLKSGHTIVSKMVAYVPRVHLKSEGLS